MGWMVQNRPRWRKMCIRDSIHRIQQGHSREKLLFGDRRRRFDRQARVQRPLDAHGGGEHPCGMEQLCPAISLPPGAGKASHLMFPHLFHMEVAALGTDGTDKIGHQPSLLSSATVRAASPTSSSSFLGREICSISPGATRSRL